MTYLYVYNQSCFFRQTKHKLLLRESHQKVKQRNWVDNFSREFPLGRAMTVAPLLEKYNGKSLLITFFPWEVREAVVQLSGEIPEQ